MCDFIFKHKVEKGRTVIYERMVCTVQPEKEEQNWTKMTIGGNLLDYPGETYTNATGLELIKRHWQSVVSTKVPSIWQSTFETFTSIHR